MNTYTFVVIDKFDNRKYRGETKGNNYNEVYEEIESWYCVELDTEPNYLKITLMEKEEV